MRPMLVALAHVLGGGCSPAHVVIEWEGHLFVGDLVANGTHNWCAQGRVDEWLKRLDELHAPQPKWIHPGRGLAGGPELLERQTEYLYTVAEAVAAERQQGPVSREGIARVVEKVKQRYPHHSDPVFLPMLLGSEWARQSGESALAPQADPSTVLP